MNQHINKNAQSCPPTKKVNPSLLLTSVSHRLVGALAIITCLWLVLGQIL